MALFLIERDIAELLQSSADTSAHIEQVKEDIGVQWLHSFLRAYNKKVYCVYKVDDPEALIECAQTLGIPADVIVEINKNRQF